MAKRVFGDPGRVAAQDAGLHRPDRACATPRRPGRRGQPAGGASAASRRRTCSSARPRPASSRSSSATTTTAATRRTSSPSPTPCGTSTRRSARAGFILQLDCPDLAMGRHIQFAATRARGVPARWRGCTSPRSTTRSPASRPSSCACTSAGATTRGRTTTTCRSPTSSTSCSRPGPQAVSFEAANPRHAHEWKRLRAGQGAAGQGHHPGRARLDDQLHRASRAGGGAHRAATRGWSAARTSSPAPTAASAPGSGQAAVDPDIAWAKLAEPGRGRPAAPRASSGSSGGSRVSAPPPPGPSGAAR